MKQRNRIIRSGICLLILLITASFFSCSSNSLPEKMYYYEMTNNWKIKGDLPVQAFLITLQGVVNRHDPLLYFDHAPDYKYTTPTSVRKYYESSRSLNFTLLKSAEEAMETFKDKVKKYVIWDKKNLTTLTVSFTVAGLENAVVVSEELIPLMEKYSMTMVEDFRDKFTGKTDTEIYSWAYDTYWEKCNKDLLIYMGGIHTTQMEPAIADYGIYHKTFFTDASADPEDGEEYELAKKILDSMTPGGMVMGWHSYKKDTEGQHVTLCSSFGLRIEGLNSLPNMSFNAQIPFTKDFKHKNNHQIKPGKEYIPEEKVYIACIQSDGLGIGSWLKPGRGEIPYAWEFLMNYEWMAPGMLQYFVEMATPNDYFIGALSGPGYMYPKAIPDHLLSKNITEAKRLMDILGLNVFEIMDHSEKYSTVNSNNDLTKDIADLYYEGMPEAIGFVNGYRSATTFDCRNGVPLMSYDYYIDPSRDEEQIVLDLKELVKMNSKRPYFMLLHTRETKDVGAVARMLGQVSGDSEIVPLDVFLKLAGNNPTFKTKYLKESKLVIK